MADSNENCSLIEKSQMTRSLSKSEFTCSCCFEIMVNPTTLNCGHSFCRHCIAQSYLITNQTNCLLCKAAWEKNPQVNILLRKTIETLFPESFEARRQTLVANGIDEIIQEFDDKMHKLNNNKSKWIHKFLKMIFVSLALGIFCTFAWIWNSSSDHPLILKPVDHWGIKDVEQWIIELGSWANIYQEKFTDNKVDGRLLLSLTDEDLSSSSFNITCDLHRRVFKKSLEDLREHGLKTPSNFWEYRQRYKGKTLFLLCGLRNFPRLTMFLIFLMDYDATFSPFFKYITSKEEENDIFMEQESTPEFIANVDFLLKFAFLPYFLIIQFSLKYLNVNYWISCYIIGLCVFSTIVEANGFRWILQVGLRTAVNFIVKQLVGTTVFITIFWLMWPLIPTLLTECLFYWLFYCFPVQQIATVIREREY